MNKKHEFVASGVVFIYRKKTNSDSLSPRKKTPNFVINNFYVIMFSS
jgi:hypothetical protein